MAAYMFLENAHAFVLHRERVPRELHHLAAFLEVQVVEGRLRKGGERALALLCPGGGQLEHDAGVWDLRSDATDLLRCVAPLHRL